MDITYGTWVEHLKDAPVITDKVMNAIRLGYTHIDTAQNYGTELYVIKGIKESGVSRDSIYFTSKLQSIIDPDILKLNLEHMEYYDLLLLHYPPLYTSSRDEFKKAILPLWEGMQSYIHNGITKSIGVSNFYQNHLDLLLEVYDENGLILPSINQLEIHPGNLELNYVPYMKSRGIIPFAHTPLGGLGSQYILNNDVLINIGNRIGATPAQVTLAYLLKREIRVVTSSKDLKHMEESINVMKFVSLLTSEDMKTIDSTELDLGPMIEGSRYSWENNAMLY